MSKEIVNLTDHPVVLTDEYGETAVIEPSGRVARVHTQTIEHSRLLIPFKNKAGGLRVPVRQFIFGAIFNLPPPKKGTVYIISRMLKMRVPDRDDCLVPDGIQRNEKGEIMNCNGLSL
jgi:hypothetical protein